MIRTKKFMTMIGLKEICSAVKPNRSSSSRIRTLPEVKKKGVRMLKRTGIQAGRRSVREVILTVYD